MLELRNFSVSIQDHQILKNINFDFEQGKIYWLRGENGSGKSSFFKSLIGIENFQTTGQALFRNELESIDLKDLSIQQRFERGLFLIFQDPPSLQGVSIIQFLKAISKVGEEGSKYESIKDFLIDVKKYQNLLGLADDFYTNDVHYGLSGGQKKRIEILQMLMLRPKYVFVDEVDSGLDENGKKTIATILNHYKGEGNTIIFSSHLPEFAELLEVDHVLKIANQNVVSL